MAQPPVPPFRSTSLPNPASAIPPDSLTHPLPRRDSGFMVNDGPITPPMSPAPSHEGEIHIVVDPEPRYSRDSDMRSSASGPPHPSVPRPRTMDRQRSEEPMEVDNRLFQRLPVGVLEDEQSHVRRGDLKLTDLEVLKTLGGSGCYLSRRHTRTLIFINFTF